MQSTDNGIAGKAHVGNMNTANKTVRPSVSVAPTKMVGTGTKAKGRMRNFSKLAINSSMKGAK